MNMRHDKISSPAAAASPFISSPEIGKNEGALRVILGELADSLEKLTGKRLRQAPAAAWERFRLLPCEQQGLLLKALREQASFLNDVLGRESDNFDEMEMLKFAMKRLGLGISEFLLQEIKEGDVIEIFGPDQTQVYRSFSCFALCNYSLLELATYPWYELYERSSLINDSLQAVGSQVLSGQTDYISLKHLPEYTLRELRTESQAVFAIRENFLARMRSFLTSANFVLSVKQIRPLEGQTAAASIRYL